MTGSGTIARRLRVTAASLVVLAACSATTPSPSPGDPSSGAPSPIVSTAPSGPASPATGPDTGGELMQVVADELRLRTAAGTDASLVEALPRGTVVRVESDPVEADGFRWLEVLTIDGQTGWAADGDATDPWLAAIPDVGSGSPIVTLATVCDVVGPLNPPTTVVMDDGWVIAPDEPEVGGWVTRQLSSAGLEEIRGAVTGSPYLQASAEYVPEPKPGAEPPGHGACQYTFTVPPEGGGEPIVVSSVGWFGDEEESTFYQPSPERRTLDALAQNLTNVIRLLDDEAWTGNALPYVPAEVVLRIDEASGGPAPDDAPEVDPAAIGIGDIDAFGAPAGTGRCGTLSRERAFDLARVLNQAVPGFAIRLNSVPTPYFMTGDRWFSIILGPRFPGGEPRCPES